MTNIDYRDLGGGNVGINEMPRESGQLENTQSGKIGKILNTAGAVMSVALVIGISIWGYRLLVRDVAGVPIVRALDGPMRIQPADPGGMQAAHQGLAVNNVKSDGHVSDIADRLVLAPVHGRIDPQDQAGLHQPHPEPRTGATRPTESADAALVTPPPSEIVAPALLTQTIPGTALPKTVTDGQAVVVAALNSADSTLSATDKAVAQALAMAEQISASSKPLGDVAEVAQKAPLALISASVAGVAQSPRPLPRPGALNTTPASAPVEVAAAQTVAANLSTNEIDAGSISPGTRLAQLGAFDSAQIARQQWDVIHGRFTEYMQGKSRVIQKAQSGGRTFYRLRVAGFDDISDARRFCSALLAEKAACIPVKMR